MQSALISLLDGERRDVTVDEYDDIRKKFTKMMVSVVDVLMLKYTPSLQPTEVTRKNTSNYRLFKSSQYAIYTSQAKKLLVDEPDYEHDYYIFAKKLKTFWGLLTPDQKKNIDPNQHVNWHRDEFTEYAKHLVAKLDKFE